MCDTTQAPCTNDSLHVACSHQTESTLSSTVKLVVDCVLVAFHLRNTWRADKTLVSRMTGGSGIPEINIVCMSHSMSQTKVTN